jgi:predicted ABC-type transport system involved in lysophospholipase L1 biosynthesis ATPase subunit
VDCLATGRDSAAIPVPVHVFSSRPSAFSKDTGPALTSDDIQRALDAIDLDLTGVVRPGRPPSAEGIVEGAVPGLGAAIEGDGSGDASVLANAGEAADGARRVAEAAVERVQRPRALHYHGTMPGIGTLSIEIAEQERVALIVPDDDRRAAAMSVLTGLRLAPGDELTLLSEALHDLSNDTRTNVRSRLMGIVSARLPLVASLTLRENIWLPLALTRGTHDAGAAVAALVDRLGVGSALDRYPEECEPALRVHAHFARSLVCRPAVVLCDLASFGPLAASFAEGANRALPDVCTVIVLCEPDSTPSWVSREVVLAREAA